MEDIINGFAWYGKNPNPHNVFTEAGIIIFFMVETW